MLAVLLREKLSSRSYEFIGCSMIMFKNPMNLYGFWRSENPMNLYGFWSWSENLWIYMSFDHQKKHMILYGSVLLNLFPLPYGVASIRCVRLSLCSVHVYAHGLTRLYMYCFCSISIFFLPETETSWLISGFD